MLKNQNKFNETKMGDFSKLILKQHKLALVQSFDAMCVRMSFLSRPMTQRYQHLIFLVSAKQSK